MKQDLTKLRFNREQIMGWLQKARRYNLAAFLVFVGLVYVFILFRIHGLSSAQPSESAVTSQVKAAQIPRVDPDVVRQLQSLQDNSVNVQALFDQARSNPFQ